MTINYRAIGLRIRESRNRLNYTQAYLAEKANLSPTNISHIERGTTKLSLPSLIAIANALNTTVDSLLKDVVDNSSYELKKDFAQLFDSCSKDEYRLMYNVCRTVINELRHRGENK